jgi:hypothetical protein
VNLLNLKSPLVNAVLLVPDDQRGTNERVLAEISNGSLLASRFLYCDNLAARRAQQWLEESTFHQEMGKWWSDNAKGLITYCQDRFFPTGVRNCDIVALGPGNGFKELPLVIQVIKNFKATNCYLYDLSWPLVAAAVKRFWDRLEALNLNCGIVPVISDFAKMKVTLKSVVPADDNSIKIFTLMGSTLGPDRDLLTRIFSCMEPQKDVLLLDFRTERLDPEPDTFRATHSFVPLKRLGVEFESDRFKWQKRQDPRTHVAEVYEAVYTFNDKDSERFGATIAKLNSDYCFDRMSLVKHLEQSGFEVLFAELQHDRFGALILRRMR